ncbi:hypothetical protein ACQI5H_24515, partial [Mycobacterium heidelbergense]|uniref:hypothetical protein n=1 Tax=Mycobacterium heidelbergense TaxID=53376 RepID=UPI003CF38D88
MRPPQIRRADPVSGLAARRSGRAVRVWRLALAEAGLRHSAQSAPAASRQRSARSARRVSPGLQHST